MVPSSMNWGPFFGTGQGRFGDPLLEGRDGKTQRKNGPQFIELGTIFFWARFSGNPSFVNLRVCSPVIVCVLRWLCVLFSKSIRLTVS